MSGLLLAGVIIGSLGVLDDVTVTQTSAVWELHEADPSMGWRGLYRAGIRIGRDHIASVVNTLVLAYAGAALPLLLLFSIAQSSVGTVANSELVAEEIVRTLVGSIGLVASVPVTTALAALVVSADRPELGAGQPVGSGAGTERQGPAAQAVSAVARTRQRPAAPRGRQRQRRGRRDAHRQRDASAPARSAGALLLRQDAARAPRRGYASKSPSVRSWPSGTSLSVRSRKATSGAALDPEQRPVAADLEPDSTSRQPLGLGRRDAHIAVPARPVEPVQQQLPAEGPGHRRIAGQMEGQPHGVGIPRLVPELHRDPEGELLGDKEAHHDLCLDRLAHRVPRSGLQARCKITRSEFQILIETRPESIAHRRSGPL